MSGAFQTTRDIFNSPIWKNIVDFRLFFLIYGQAVFSDEGVRLADDLTLNRGQWCRSTRKLQEDLVYIENRQIKKYSTSVINRCIKRLVDMQMICTKTHELGTVFTVVNYDKYQGLDNYRKDNLERNLEQSGNSSGTVEEQSRNNNKNVNKDNKDKKELLKDKYSDESPYYKMAVYFYMRILEWTDKVSIPNYQKWADDCRKLVEIDKRDMNLVKSVMDWSTKDSFWQANILSPDKLRKKFETLVVQMEKSSKYRQRSQPQTLSGKPKLQVYQSPKAPPVSDEEMAEIMKLAEELDNRPKRVDTG